MAHKRFLRDGIFELLIHEMELTLDILSQNEDDDNPENYLIPYINSILISYKTCKITLERIEETIEISRPSDSTGEICVPLCEACTHIKSGILSLHETAWRNTESIREEKQIEFNEFETLIQDHYTV